MVTARVEARLRGEAIPATVELEALRRDGTRFWLAATATVVEWRGGLGHLRLLHRHQRPAAPRGRGARSREPPLGGQGGQRRGPRDQQSRSPWSAATCSSSPSGSATGRSSLRYFERGEKRRSPDRRHDHPDDTHHPAHATHRSGYRRSADPGPPPLQRARPPAEPGEAGSDPGRARRDRHRDRLRAAPAQLHARADPGGRGHADGRAAAALLAPRRPGRATPARRRRPCACWARISCSSATGGDAPAS